MSYHFATEQVLAKSALQLAEAFDDSVTTGEDLGGGPPRGNVLQFDASASPATIARKVMQVLEPISELPSTATGIQKTAVAGSASTGKTAASKLGLAKRTAVAKSASTGKFAASEPRLSNKTAPARSASTSELAAGRSANTLQLRRGR